MFEALRNQRVDVATPTNWESNLPPEPSEGEDLNPAGVSDEELRAFESGFLSLDMSGFFEVQKRDIEIPPLSPSQFTEFAFYLPKKGGGYAPFSFAERRHLLRPYNSPSKRILLFCARQCEKCCHSMSSVLLENGQRKFAKDVKVGDRVVTMSKDGVHTEVRPVTWVSALLKKPCVKLTTSRGNETIVATTHPMRVLTTWVESQHLCLQDPMMTVQRGGLFLRKHPDKTSRELERYAVELRVNYPEGADRLADWVFDLSRTQTLVLLSHFFLMGTAYVHTDRKELVRDLQALCWKIGFASKLTQGNQCYVLSLCQPAEEDSDLISDALTGIEDVGEQECIDFEVEETHNFVADGFVSHNSTLLGNRMIGRSCLCSDHKTLYVSPSSTQTRTFSIDRLKDPIEVSPVLKGWTSSMLMQNVFEKQFINRSKITLRYAFLNPDRARGIAAKDLCLDEVQDLMSDHIPIIEQCTSHYPDESTFVYSGTPKGLDNPLEYYRGTLSTQGEWVVPCDRCGSADHGGRHWNILGEKNIGKKGLICEKCGELIDPRHIDAQWAFAVPRPTSELPFESFRISQLMVPWISWDEILLNYKRYPRDKFYNEVLGLSYDSGLRPLTQRHIRECCNPQITMHPDVLEQLRKDLHGLDVYAGIDWGSGENSYTVLSLGYYKDSKFRIFFVHRFIGEDVDPEPQREKIYAILHAFGVRVAGTDYGGGFDRNDFLVRKLGPQRIQKFQYVPRPKRKMNWEPKLHRWIVHRTEVMSDVFNAIKRNQLEFPRWEEFKEPYAQDMLNIFSEYNVTLRMVQYNHRPDKPDDTFHSILLCFLASMLVHSRPDIMSPIREDPNVGGLMDQGWYEVNQ